jgi:transposase-like protein
LGAERKLSVKKNHSPEFKESVVQKISMPGGPSIMEMSEKMGIHHSTIRRWISIYANTNPMKKSKEWTPEAKLKAIAETLNMTDDQLGEYLRTNGLYSSDLDQWRQDFYSSQKSSGRPKLDPEIVELRTKEKELSKDLKRKDRALAEMSARIVLLKKSRLIWGDAEEDE